MLFLGSQEVAPNSYAPEAGLKRGIADSLKLAYALYIDGTRTKNAGGGLTFCQELSDADHMQIIPRREHYLGACPMSK